jgi:phosphatidate phosphatase APP1
VKSDILARVSRILASGVIVLLLGRAPIIAAENAGPQVAFFPSIAAVSENGVGTMTIQGRVFTPAAGAHAGLVRLSARWLASNRKIQLKETDEPFHSRALLFFSDGRRNVRVSIRFGTRIVNLPRSDPSGYFSDVIALTAEERQAVENGVISFETVASTTAAQTFRGTATVVPRDALVVVTDMDDTIKDTNVLDRAASELNTFVKAFRPVSGMPEVYRNWNSASGIKLHFHVVSAGPWQLHTPLREFTDGANFPPFTWDMRTIDIGFDPVVALREIHPNPNVIFRHKVAKIRALLKRLPNPVVLVGDSAEQDPEVYAAIAQVCPDRVAAVFIREIANARERDYGALFGAGAGIKPQLFRVASDLPLKLSNPRIGPGTQCR